MIYSYQGMRTQGEALEMYASRDVKVCVIANPANTNCLVAMKSAPSIPKENFTCLTRLDEERLKAFLAEELTGGGSGGTDKISISAKDVRGACILGNHSATQVPFIAASTIVKSPSDRSVFETALVPDFLTVDQLDGLITKVCTFTDRFWRGISTPSLLTCYNCMYKRTLDISVSISFIIGITFITKPSCERPTVALPASILTCGCNTIPILMPLTHISLPISQVQTRGAEIISKLGASSGMSAAHAVGM